MTILVTGVAGFIGTVVMGALDKVNFYYTLVSFPLIMAAIALVLVSLGGQMTATVALLALWAFVSTPAPVGWWSWLAKALPENAEAGGGLMVAVIQLAIGLGSVIGGVLFDNSGYQSTFAASAALLLVSAALAALTARADQAGR